jgi:hypothetical protein
MWEMDNLFISKTNCLEAENFKIEVKCISGFTVFRTNCSCAQVWKSRFRDFIFYFPISFAPKVGFQKTGFTDSILPETG